MRAILLALTIQAAVDAAAPGDTIHLSGLYTGPGNRDVYVPIPLTFQGLATIDCEGTGRAFLVDAPCTFRDINIQNARPEWGAAVQVVSESADLEMTWCRFGNCAGAIAYYGGEVDLAWCTFGSTRGVAVAASGGNKLNITDCTFAFSTGPHITSDDWVILKYSTLWGSQAEAIRCGDGAQVRAYCSLFHANAGGNKPRCLTKDSEDCTVAADKALSIERLSWGVLKGGYR